MTNLRINNIQHWSASEQIYIFAHIFTVCIIKHTESEKSSNIFLVILSFQDRLYNIYPQDCTLIWIYGMQTN